MNDNIETDDIVSGLTPMEIEKIYRIQYKIYWEEDLIDRCNDRRTEGQGLCNLPDTLEDEKDLLNTAYDLYCKIKDSNIAYNDTLDAVIDEMERRIANEEIPVASGLECIGGGDEVAEEHCEFEKISEGGAG